MTKKLPSPKLFWDDITSIFKAYRWQMIWIAVLSGFLLFLLNILLGVSLYGNSFNEGLKDKLGMYFYIKDVPEKEEQIYKQVIHLKEKLQDAGLKVDFSTKEDALNFLQKRLPDLTGSFAKFWMKNPLPATLYVTFHNQSQYQILQKMLNEYSDIILNVQDLSQIDSIQQQETRIVNIIKLSNVVQVLCYALVLVLVAVILSFAVFFLRGIFTTFRNDIQVKKLLGASKTQIIQPFMWTILYAIIGGFVLSLVFTVVSLGVFDYYMMQVFTVSLLEHLMERWVVIVEVFVGEVIIIVTLLAVVSYVFVSGLHKKLK